MMASSLPITSGRRDESSSIGGRDGTTTHQIASGSRRHERRRPYRGPIKEITAKRAHQMNQILSHDIDQRCIDAARVISVDMSEKARSGHPGLPLRFATC